MNKLRRAFRFVVSKSKAGWRIIDRFVSRHPGRILLAIALMALGAGLFYIRYWIRNFFVLIGRGFGPMDVEWWKAWGWNVGKFSLALAAISLVVCLLFLFRKNIRAIPVQSILETAPAAAVPPVMPRVRRWFTLWRMFLKSIIWSGVAVGVALAFLASIVWWEKLYNFVSGHIVGLALTTLFVITVAAVVLILTGRNRKNVVAPQAQPAARTTAQAQAQAKQSTGVWIIPVALLFGTMTLLILWAVVKVKEAVEPFMSGGRRTGIVSGSDRMTTPRSRPRDEVVVDSNETREAIDRLTKTVEESGDDTREAINDLGEKVDAGFGRVADRLDTVSEKLDTVIEQTKPKDDEEKDLKPWQKRARDIQKREF